MEEIPREERPSINLEELDLTTLYRIRDLIGLRGGAGMAAEAILADKIEDPIDPAIESEAIREYIAQRERRIRLEEIEGEAKRWKELADEVDAIIASKEAGEVLGL